MSGKVLMFGGASDQSSNPATVFDDSWEWNGSSWTQLGGNQPISRFGHVMGFDPIARRIIMFGGSNGAFLNDTWAWASAATGWQQLTPAAHPPALVAAAMAYDAKQRMLTLFGGGREAFSIDETWQWNGSSCQERLTITLPDARSEHTAAYDRVRGTFVVFGGVASETASTPLGDMWSLQSSNVNNVADACTSSTFDHDSDGLLGGADPDCLGRTDPLCPSGASNCDAARSRCGFGGCNAALEDYVLCPIDCPTP